MAKRTLTTTKAPPPPVRKRPAPEELPASLPLHVSKQYPIAADAPPLAQLALQTLTAASAVPVDEGALLVEERNIWQPESWLVQRCWETLADGGIGREVLEVAALMADRQPLAPLQALQRMAQQVATRPALLPLVEHELERWAHRLFRTFSEEGSQIERLLLLGISAARIEDTALAASCLERLDQLPKGWSRVVARPETREQLADCIAHIGPHPLVNSIINNAIRRHDEAGAQLIYAITTQLSAQINSGTTPPRTLDRLSRLMTRCVDTIRFGALISLQSRRVAAIILGQAGQVEAVLAQLAVIQSVQEAQRATGYTAQKDDAALLRQVKRTSANREVDFLVYTLRNAIAAMPLRRLSREERITLADQLAMLGIRSDGWTAASAAATLIELGALKYAIEVVEHIAPNDPARSEGLLALVRGLLANEEIGLANEQAKGALTWARAQASRNPERALTWGLAELYLQQQRAEIALQFLPPPQVTNSWRLRLQRWWGDGLDDDELRNSRLRLQALLQLERQAAADSAPTPNAASQPNGAPAATLPPATARERAQEVQELLRSLRRAAPRLLEGEALIHFYIDSLLRPLLAAGRQAQAWELLPLLQQALATSSGSKHAARVAEVAELLIAQLDAPEQDPKTNQLIDKFLRDLWQESSQRGIWQAVHSIEGMLGLLLAREGPSSLVVIARGAVQATTSTV